MFIFYSIQVLFKTHSRCPSSQNIDEDHEQSDTSRTLTGISLDDCPEAADVFDTREKNPGPANQSSPKPKTQEGTQNPQHTDIIPGLSNRVTNQTLNEANNEEVHAQSYEPTPISVSNTEPTAELDIEEKTPADGSCSDEINKAEEVKAYVLHSRLEKQISRSSLDELLFDLYDKHGGECRLH